jgi:hypothetical protein
MSPVMREKEREREIERARERERKREREKERERERVQPATGDSTTFISNVRRHLLGHRAYSRCMM